MKAGALGFSLILLMVPLAGCAGSDTDVNVDISSEELQQMIDDNKDDFLNNTTVVVFQEYYNNTTIVNNNQYDNNYTNNTSNNYNSSNTSNYDQSVESNSHQDSNDVYYNNNTEPEIFIIDITFTGREILGLDSIRGPKNNNFSVSWEYYNYENDTYVTEIFNIECYLYYDAYAPGNTDYRPTYWNDSSNYDQWWNSFLIPPVVDILVEYADSDLVESTCIGPSDGTVFISKSDYEDGTRFGTHTNYNISDSPVFYEMTIPNGSALRILGINSGHHYMYYSSSMWGGTTYTNGFQADWWGVNDFASYQYVPNDMCTGVYTLIKFGDAGNDGLPFCNSDLIGGWGDWDLNFQVASSIYETSVFYFTMYYELVPVTAL